MLGGVGRLLNQAACWVGAVGIGGWWDVLRGVGRLLEQTASWMRAVGVSSWRNVLGRVRWLRLGQADGLRGCNQSCDDIGFHFILNSIIKMQAVIL